ncbi:hypothetical protein C446_01178 [Halobiforma nitratireducens JCM 10879]|uniref:Uncharacterized protein n=1 Tax=Halobiforma nitratireducens JCM 10879 TaxID=1227454 RepID=M0MNX8_9EURY|nr:hypothetical protein C446_01178 [Halobiforma nitratireducens JCM 10879]
MLERSDGQPGYFEAYRESHEKRRRHDGWCCFVVYRPHGRSGCTLINDEMTRASTLALLR